MDIDNNNSRKKEKCKIDNNSDAKILGGQRNAGIESGYT